MASYACYVMLAFAGGKYLQYTVRSNSTALMLTLGHKFAPTWVWRTWQGNVGDDIYIQKYTGLY